MLCAAEPPAFTAERKAIAMKKLLLTSAGFETAPILQCFLSLLEQPPQASKALWIPTAAIEDGHREVLPKCRNDLRKAGFPEENVTEYNLDRPMAPEELAAYGAVYFCGGSPQYLLERIHTAGFDGVLDGALERGLVYVGVSAGSIVAAQNLPGGLGYLDRVLEVHCDGRLPCGALPPGAVRLPNDQAVRIADGEARIVG